MAKKVKPIAISTVKSTLFIRTHTRTHIQRRVCICIIIRLHARIRVYTICIFSYTINRCRYVSTQMCTLWYTVIYAEIQNEFYI